MPAQAYGNCAFQNIIKTVDDYSETKELTGYQCSRIGAQHEYWPQGGSKSYWTSWRYTETLRYVRSSPQPEIMRGRGVGYS